MPRNTGFAPTPAAQAVPRAPFGAAQTAATKWVAPVFVASEDMNPTRKFGFIILLIFVFIRLSLTHEVMAYQLGLPTFVLLVFGSLTVVFTILSGGLMRAMRHPAGMLWLVFSLLMVFATSFSIWVGGSSEITGPFFKTSLPMYFGIAGTVCTWRECRKLLIVMGWAGALYVLVTRLVGDTSSGRLEIKSLPSIGNSNDLSAHMIYVLPYLIIVAVNPSVGKFVRFVAAAFVGWGLVQILATGSRGAMIGIAAGVLFILVRGTAKQKAAGVLIMVAAGLGLAVTIISSPASRLANMFGDAGNSSNNESTASSEARSYLLRKSIEMTFTHPVFGLGPGQFIEMMDRTSRAGGENHSQVTHNTYTEISSEIGLPGLICVLAILFLTARSLRQAMLQARLQGETELAMAAFCISAGMVAFCTTIIFLAMAYRQYLAGISGIGVAVAASIQHELALRAAAKAAGPQPQPGMTPLFAHKPVRKPLQPRRPMPV